MTNPLRDALARVVTDWADQGAVSPDVPAALQAADRPAEHPLDPPHLPLLRLALRVAVVSLPRRGRLLPGTLTERLDRLESGRLGPPGLGPCDRLSLSNQQLVDASEGLTRAAPAPVNLDLLGDAYAALLAHQLVYTPAGWKLQRGADRRQVQGSFYTPRFIADYLVEQTLDPTTTRVLDPACGAGHLLRAAGRRLRLTLGEAAGEALFGVDPDPLAIELCRCLLWLDGLDVPADHLRQADSLLEDLSRDLSGDLSGDLGGEPRWPAFDAVIGNPPFLNQLERATALAAGRRQVLNQRFPGMVDAYTDLSGLFLVVGLRALRPGGKVALVLPQSVLAAAHAAPLRAAVTRSDCIRSIWLAGAQVFPGAEVRVVVVVVERDGPRQVEVGRSVGDQFEPLAPVSADMDVLTRAPGWAPLVGDALGLPVCGIQGDGSLGDIATATADFRDEYYGLGPYVVERAEADELACPRLILTRHIDPAHNRWGEVSTRFLKRSFTFPRLDRAAIPTVGEDAWLHTWVSRRMRPKVLLATQTPVLEAVVDEAGSLLCTTPVISVFPNQIEDLWRVAAVLLSPPVAVWALAHYGGTALDFDAIKLSARQVTQVPLPRDTLAWEEAAGALRAAQAGAPEALDRAAAAMCRAYGVGPDVLGWWRARLLRGPGRRVVVEAAETGQAP